MVKTLEEVIALYGNNLPEEVVLAIYLEQSNLSKEEIDEYINQFNAEKNKNKPEKRAIAITEVTNVTNVNEVVNESDLERTLTTDLENELVEFKDESDEEDEVKNIAVM